MQYIRNCPVCGKEMVNQSKHAFKYAVENNSKCRTCRRIGFSLTQESREKIRKTLTGRTLPEEHKTKIGIGVNIFLEECKQNNVKIKSVYECWLENEGKEVADIKMEQYRKKASIRSSGANNPMFGKPSPQGSGNGWKCWYGKHFCRSLRELMFILKLESEGLEWKTGECQKIQIKYLDYKEQERNYFPDFIVGSIMYEVKPKRLWETPLIKAKTEAAKIYCKERDMTFEIVDIEIDFKAVNDLYSTGKIKFSEKYEKKFIEFRDKL